MFSIESFKELALISALTKQFSRHPDQLNRQHESDAGLILQGDGSYLAVSVDTLIEEYATGLIRDPFAVGWSTVAHSLSDLAAVTADPVGVLLAVTFSRSSDAAWQHRFFEGAHGALERHETFCLGGDTSFGSEMSFTCTSIGRVRGHPPVTRIGMGPGDSLYTTGPLGTGNLLAILSRVDRDAHGSLEASYRPVARFAEGRTLAPFMKCAIDTSDALLQAMAILAALNRVGIDFHHHDGLYDPRLVQMAPKIRFPLWLVNAFGLGEHELLFAVDRGREDEFLRHASRSGVPVLKVGQTSPERGIRLSSDGKAHTIDVPYLLNLFSSCASVDEYLGKLVAYDVSLRQTK